MYSGGGGAHCAAAGAPARKTAASAPVADTIAKPVDSEAIFRFMSSSLGRRSGVLVLETLSQVGRQLRTLVRRQHGGDRLEEIRAPPYRAM
jgi:hypothetical protein